MTNLDLELNEGIILQSAEVTRYGKGTDKLQEMVLTNKNIICIIEKRTGFFKSERYTYKIPLESIKVANGQAQVMKMNNDSHGLGLQILYTNGDREHFVFLRSPRKEIQRWIDAINNVLLKGDQLPDPASSVDPNSSSGKKHIFENLQDTISGALNFDMQSVVEKAQSKITEIPQQMTDKIQEKIDGIKEDSLSSDTSYYAPPKVQSVEGEIAFCPNCGTKLNENAKFCHGCGAAINADVNSSQSAKVQPEIQQENHYNQRQQEYAGKILKCPNCGEVITETTVICPSCGMQITGRAAVSSVQAFKDQLMAIESSRKHGFGGALGFYTAADKADIKKLSLIKTFPIPNSIDDCLEFMMLAEANIDVGLSKNTIMNKMNKAGNSIETSATISRTISDAWVLKMNQCFPTTPHF